MQSAPLWGMPALRHLSLCKKTVWRRGAGLRLVLARPFPFLGRTDRAAQAPISGFFWTDRDHRPYNVCGAMGQGPDRASWKGAAPSFLPVVDRCPLLRPVPAQAYSFERRMPTTPQSSRAPWASFMDRATATLWPMPRRASCIARWSFDG